MTSADFVNVKHLPPGIQDYLKLAKESTAYYNMDAYPYYGFSSWRTEELGPYPRCLPIPLAIIRRSAIWLFGKPINFTFPGNDAIEKALHQAWDINEMQLKLVMAAVKGGKEGGIALKFSYDASRKDRPIRFQILSCAEHVKFFYNPHDAEDLIMARIQYPFFDYKEGCWYWYREEWTKEEEIHYNPVKIAGYGQNMQNPYLFTGEPLFPSTDLTVDWAIISRDTNKFGLIPIVPIKNIDNGSQFGSGDLFGLHRIIDRINLTFHLMDRSNQLDVDPRVVLIDLEPKIGDSMDIAKQPGGVMDVKSVESDDGSPTKQGKVEYLETEGKIREHLLNYANEMRQMLFDATGAVFPRQEQITNKGALTQSVLIQMYAPLLEITNEKRKTYGDEGIAKFLQTVVLGLANLGVKPFNKMKAVSSLVDPKMELPITWFNQFEMTEDEKFAEYDRLDRAVTSSFITPRIAIEKYARLEEVSMTEEDVNKLVKDIEDAKQREIEQHEAGIASSESAGRPGTRVRGNDPKSGDNKQPKQAKQQQRGNRVNDAE